MKTYHLLWNLLGVVRARSSSLSPNFLPSHGDNNVCNNGILCHLMPPWLLFPQPRHLLSPCPIDLQDFNKRLFVTKIWKKSYLAPPDDATPPFSTCVCISLGTNSSMFANCSVFCDVQHVWSSVQLLCDQTSLGTYSLMCFVKSELKTARAECWIEY